MKTSIILICVGLYLFSEQSCQSKAQDARSERRTRQAANKPVYQDSGFEILMNSCSEEKCVVIAYCEPALFNESDMRKIAEGLAVEFGKKKVVNVNLFDNRERAKAYANGTRNLGDIDEERRGWYLRTDDREFLLFFPDATRQGKQISINLKP